MATIGKWHRNINQGGVYRSIHGSHLIGQYIVRCTKGWAVNDCPSGHGELGERSEHARFIEAKRHADKRVKGVTV
jgi:hypothetical protein